MRPAAYAALLLSSACGLAAPSAHADASVQNRLAARDVQYEVDADGDYKIIYRYGEDKRTQIAFVSGHTEQIRGLVVREVFSPAARVAEDGVDGAKALELLTESRRNKLGSWELDGGYLLFVIKVPDTLDAAGLEAAIDIAAQTADDMEIQLSGTKDAL